MSPEELEEQIALGRMSETNLPVYVASVTYGQIMMFSATSSASTSELKGAFSASFNSFAGGGSAKLIREGEPGAFFEGSAVVTSSVPIAYTLKDLRGNIVKIVESTEYGLTTCTPTGTANVYALSAADNTASVLGYYADGSEAELSNGISVGMTVLETARTYMDIAYDALEDSILVLSKTVSRVNPGGPTSAAVDVYTADGAYLNSFRVDSGATAMACDPIRARVYVLQGNEVEVAGGFGGIREPQGIAYDPNLNRPSAIAYRPF